MSLLCWGLAMREVNVWHKTSVCGERGGQRERERERERDRERGREFYNHLKESHPNIINNLREILERSPISQLVLGHKQSPQTEIPRD